MDVSVVFQNHHYSPFLSHYVKLKLEEVAEEIPPDSRLQITIEESQGGKIVIYCRLRSAHREWGFEQELSLNAKHAVDQVIAQIKKVSKTWSSPAAPRLHKA